MRKEFFSVSELNTLIKEVINYGFPDALWVCGEIQGFDRNKHKNHIFFDLCEKDPQSKEIVARIGLVIFAGRKAYLEGILKSAENAFTLKDDIEVKFLCRVDFYPPHGAVRLVVENIDPIYTLGKIAQERQKLIALLKKEGILDKNKLIPLPLVPLRVGLISAYDSAAYNDFLSELKHSGFGFRIFFIPSLMQGKGAEEGVCQALTRFNQLAMDVVVITRGGGSIAELSCFDSRAIVEKIASSRYPVLSGIGHEINITITDLAAHTYAKTPTAIAQFLVEQVTQFMNNLDEKLDQLLTLSTNKIGEEKRQLRFWAMGLHKQTTTFFKIHDQILVRFRTHMQDLPLQLMNAKRREIVHQRQKFLRGLKVMVTKVYVTIKHYSKLVELVSPQNTMRRGFSITRTEKGELIRSLTQAHPKKAIRTEVVDGIIQSRVFSREEEVRGG